MVWIISLMCINCIWLELELEKVIKKMIRNRKDSESLGTNIVLRGAPHVSFNLKSH